MESPPKMPRVIRSPALLRSEGSPVVASRISSGVPSGKRGLLGSLGIHGALIAAAFSFTWMDSKPHGSDNDASPGEGGDFEMESPARELSSSPAPVPSGLPPDLPAKPLLVVAKRETALNLPPVESMFRETRPPESAPSSPTGTTFDTPSASTRQAAEAPARRSAKSEGRKGGGNGPQAGRKQTLTPPKLVHAPPPHYPSQAKSIGKTGKAAVLIHVRADGSAASASLYHSSGNSQLDLAAVQAARSWTFSKTPELASGETFAVVVQVTFTL